jgi:hypothetical protein
LPPAERPSNTTVRRHLEGGALEERGAGDDAVAAFWRKAIVAYNDAGLASSSLDNRLLRAYDAGRIAALAIVRAAGYRTRGGDGHHYVTFDVARSLAEDADLRDALDAMNGIRTLRHDVEYEPEDDIDTDTVATAVAVAARIINGGAQHLRGVRPAVKARIKKVRNPATPDADDQRWFQDPEVQARIAEAEADFSEGRVIRTSTPEEAQAYLDSLKRNSG